MSHIYSETIKLKQTKYWSEFYNQDFQGKIYMYNIQYSLICSSRKYAEDIPTFDTNQLVSNSNFDTKWQHKSKSIGK